MQAAPADRCIGSAETPAGGRTLWVEEGAELGALGPSAKSTHWAGGSEALPGASWGSEVAHPMEK